MVGAASLLEHALLHEVDELLLWESHNLGVHLEVVLPASGAAGELRQLQLRGHHLTECQPAAQA